MSLGEWASWAGRSVASVVVDGFVTTGEASVAGAKYVKQQIDEWNGWTSWKNLATGSVTLAHDVLRNVTDTTRPWLDFWFAARLLSLPGESKGPAFELSAALYYGLFYIPHGGFGVLRALLSRYEGYAGKASGIYLRILELASGFVSVAVIGLASLIFVNPNMDLKEDDTQKINLIFFYTAMLVSFIPAIGLSALMSSMPHRFPILLRTINRIIKNNESADMGKIYKISAKEVSTLESMRRFYEAKTNLSGLKYWYQQSKDAFLMLVEYVRAANRLHFLLEFVIPALQGNRNSNLLFTLIAGFLGVVNAASIAMKVPFAKRSYLGFKTFGLSLENTFTVANFLFLKAFSAVDEDDWSSNNNATISFLFLLAAWGIGLPTALKQAHDDSQCRRMFNPTIDKNMVDESKIALIFEEENQIVVGTVFPGSSEKIFGGGFASDLFRPKKKVIPNGIKFTEALREIEQENRNYATYRS